MCCQLLVDETRRGRQWCGHAAACEDRAVVKRSRFICEPCIYGMWACCSTLRFAKFRQHLTLWFRFGMHAEDVRQGVHSFACIKGEETAGESLSEQQCPEDLSN